MLERLVHATRPFEKNPVRCVTLPETHVQAQIIGGEIACGRFNLQYLLVPRTLHLNARPDPIAVALRSLQFQKEGALPLPDIVPKNGWRAVAVVYDHIDVPIIIQITERSPSANRTLTQRPPGSSVTRSKPSPSLWNNKVGPS